METLFQETLFEEDVVVAQVFSVASQHYCLLLVPLVPVGDSRCSILMKCWHIRLADKQELDLVNNIHSNSYQAHLYLSDASPRLAMLTFAFLCEGGASQAVPSVGPNLHSDYISLNSELDHQSLQDRASVLVYSPQSSCGLLRGLRGRLLGPGEKPGVTKRT